jgi:ribosomal protein L7/L12
VPSARSRQRAPVTSLTPQTRLNITEVALPAAAAAPAAGGAAAAPVEEAEKPKEKTIFTLKLEKIDAAAKAKIIREVKGLMPNMNLVEVSKEEKSERRRRSCLFVMSGVGVLLAHCASLESVIRNLVLATYSRTLRSILYTLYTPFDLAFRASRFALPASRLLTPQAKKFVESVPQVLKENVPKEEAEALMKKLQDLGATVSMS